MGGRIVFLCPRSPIIDLPFLIRNIQPSISWSFSGSGSKLPGVSRAKLENVSKAEGTLSFIAKHPRILQRKNDRRRESFYAESFFGCHGCWSKRLSVLRQRCVLSTLLPPTATGRKILILAVRHTDVGSTGCISHSTLKTKRIKRNWEYFCYNWTPPKGKMSRQRYKFSRKWIYDWSL